MSRGSNKIQEQKTEGDTATQVGKENILMERQVMTKERVTQSCGKGLRNVRLRCSDRRSTRDAEQEPVSSKIHNLWQVINRSIKARNSQYFKTRVRTHL